MRDMPLPMPEAAPEQVMPRIKLWPEHYRPAAIAGPWPDPGFGEKAGGVRLSPPPVGATFAVGGVTGCAHSSGRLAAAHRAKSRAVPCAGAAVDSSLP
jgi:hypothetical protein